MRNSRSVVPHRLAIALATLVLAFTAPHFLWAQANLENPQPGSFQSGIGLVSGWKCTANTITVSFDGGPQIQAAYGTSREDTRSVCGDANNGFGLLFNWNLLGNGVHTISALADGVQFASVTFTVTTLGTEFLRGASGRFRLLDFPRAGTNVIIRWQESAQNFVIEGVEGDSTAFNLTGTWQGSWESSIFDVGGSVTAFFTQTGSSFTGSVSITGSPCFTSGSVSGTVSGNTVVVGVVFGGDQSALFEGTVDTSGTTMEGTYEVSGGECSEDEGFWSLTKSG